MAQYLVITVLGYYRSWLFLLFINHLPAQVECELYGDDSKLMSLANNKDDNNKLQNDIIKVMEWKVKG